MEKENKDTATSSIIMQQGNSDSNAWKEEQEKIQINSKEFIKILKKFDSTDK